MLMLQMGKTYVFKNADIIASNSAALPQVSSCYVCARNPFVKTADQVVTLQSVISYLRMCLQFNFTLFYLFIFLSYQPCEDLQLTDNWSVFFLSFFLHKSSSFTAQIIFLMFTKISQPLIILQMQSNQLQIPFKLKTKPQ